MGFAIDPDETDMAQQSKNATASVTWLSPEQHTEPIDTSPSEIQPPGVDEDIDLEEALTTL